MEKRLKATSNTKGIIHSLEVHEHRFNSYSPFRVGDANGNVEGNQVDDDEDNNRGLSGSADDVITRSGNSNSNAGNANVRIPS